MVVVTFRGEFDLAAEDAASAAPAEASGPARRVVRLAGVDDEIEVIEDLRR